jgi:hypothetical protein
MHRRRILNSSFIDGNQEKTMTRHVDTRTNTAYVRDVQPRRDRERAETRHHDRPRDRGVPTDMPGLARRTTTGARAPRGAGPMYGGGQPAYAQPMPAYAQPMPAYAYPMPAYGTPVYPPHQGYAPDVEMRGYTPPPREPSPMDVDQYGRPLDNVHVPRNEGLRHLEATRPNMVGVELFAGTPKAILDSVGIHSRAGGSLVAAQYGGGRHPEDVDLEFNNGHDLEAAYQTLANFNGQVTLEGQQFQVRGQKLQHNPGMGAQIYLHFADSAGRTQSIPVDLTNENNPAFNEGLIAPQARGIGAGSSRQMSPEELVVNYLDRMGKKPDTAMRKGDAQQIASILRNQGFNVNSGTQRSDIRAGLSQLVQGDRLELYAGRLESIIAGMRRGEL